MTREVTVEDFRVGTGRLTFCGGVWCMSAGIFFDPNRANYRSRRPCCVRRFFNPRQLRHIFHHEHAFGLANVQRFMTFFKHTHTRTHMHTHMHTHTRHRRLVTRTHTSCYTRTHTLTHTSRSYTHTHTRTHTSCYNTHTHTHPTHMSRSHTPRRTCHVTHTRHTTHTHT